MGVGAMPDADKYGDSPSCNTLSNVAAYNNGLNLPNLQKLGLGNITNVQGVPPVDKPMASYGCMQEVSEGKDTTTGHWELAGLVLDKPFRVFPDGFPNEFMEKFVKISGCKGYYANCPASGTDIISKYNDRHKNTGFPIIYTSADSVFQIACNVDVAPIETLYKWCEIARNLLDDNYNTSRVIARPYKETVNGLQRISSLRKDYSVEPNKPTMLNKIKDNNGLVIAVGKIEDIFVGSGVTHSVHTGSNNEGLEVTLKAIKRNLCLEDISVSNETSSTYDKELIFVNLVDTDMLYGHRNDVAGYGAALEEIDKYLEYIIPLLNSEDMLIITADHGCDPTQPGTDHTREMVPILAYNSTEEAISLGVLNSFTYVADKTLQWLNIS